MADLAVTAVQVLLIIIFTVATIALFGWLIRGWLGVRFSLFRIMAAGAIAVFIATPILNALNEPFRETEANWTGFWFTVLGFALATVCGVLFLVVAEALVPSNTLPGPIYTIRASRRMLQRMRRYLHIGRLLFRHGLIAYLHGGRRGELRTSEGRADLARRMQAALNDGGVTFVKLGQILSTRRDLLPPEFIEAFSRLQDRAATVAWADIEATLRTEIGNPDLVFATFEREPLAAASIAQVHLATLHTGEEVVVKVRRPGIEAQVERDLDIVDKLASTLDSSTAWGRAIGARDLADGFAEALREELDLRVEARNLAVVAGAAAARGGDDGVYLPTLYPDLSTSRVLTMERIRGIPLSAAGEAIDARGLERAALADALLSSLLRQMAIDGTFHADPHPGNVMLLEDGRLTLLDFGSVGRIDAVLRGSLIRLILAFNQGDPMAASDALLDLVERPDGLDEHRLERSLGQFMARFLTPGVPPDTRMFTDLFRIVAAHRLAIPPEVAAVFRAIGTLEGTLSLVSPGFNLIGGARAFASEYLEERMRPSALRRTIQDELITLLPMLRRLPRRIDRIADALEEGRLSLNVRPMANAEDRRSVGALVHEILVTFLASTAGIMAVLLFGMETGPRLTDEVTLFQFFGFALMVVALMLALRVLVLIFRPTR
jgi:ubiquinone biosynthesis protein